MTIVQGLIASISGGGATPLDPGFQFVDSNLSLGGNWTIEIIGSFNPTTYWATIWGNEVWNSSQGHLAYLNGAQSLMVGAPNSENQYIVPEGFITKAYWVFTHIDGGGIDVYRNGVLLTPYTTGYVQPSSTASNTLLYGARHGNDGTGTADPIGPATYDYYDAPSMAFDATMIAQNYENLRASYGI